MKDSPVLNAVMGKPMHYNNETKRKTYIKYDDIGLLVDKDEANACLSCDLPDCTPNRNCNFYKYRRGKK